MLLIGVFTSDPPKSTVVLLLEEKAAYPEVLRDAGLVIETVFLLSDVDPHTRLLEDCEGAHGSGIVWRQLEVLALGLFLRTGFDNLGWIDGTGNDRGKFIQGVEEK
jgi:hypothetical protein